jgi:ABC-type amino acid transport substrate-binding protein
MRYVLTVILSVAISWLVLSQQAMHSNRPVETAFDRIMHTRVIRCGYYIYPPVTYKDPNTGKLSGLSVDMMERIAKRADLKIEWTQEVNFGDWAQGLQNKRYDLACTPMWPNTATGQVAYFTKPFLYAGIYPVGRGDETRFRTLDDLNNPGLTWSGQEGNENFALAKEVFPQAKFIGIAPNADGNLVAQDVMTHKADFMITDKNLIAEINKTNPNGLKVLVDEPVKHMPFTLAVGRGENDLLQFTNNAIDEMIVTGEIDRLLKKWAADPGVYQTVAPAWTN